MNTLPTYAERRRNFTQAATEVAGSSQGPHVSIRGNRFTLIDGAGNEKMIATRDDQGRDCMDFIIANIHTQGKVNRVYYADKFVPGQEDNKPPTCFSDNGLAPSSQAQSPQSASCATCQWAVWGSAVSDNGVKKPACASAKKLAIVQPGDKMVFQLRVPPASLSHFSNYAKAVSQYTDPQTKAPMSVADVVTRAFFISQGVIDFVPIAQIDPKDLATVEALWTNPDALDDVVGNRDKPWIGAIAAPTAPTQIAAPPVAQPAPPPLPQPGQLTGASTPVAEKPRGRGRPKKEEAAPAPQGQPVQAPFMSPAQPGPAATPPFATQAPPIELPNFLQRPPAQQAAPPTQQFGIASNAQAPNPELAAALEAALNLPT